MEDNLFEIKDLHAKIEGKQILNGINLTIKQGEIHAIMGPNGSGKSTLASVVMGHPKYEITKGTVLYKGKNLLELKANERAALGLFLSFQHPLEIAGLKLFTFLRAAYKARFPDKQLTIAEFQELLSNSQKKMGFSDDLSKRDLNVGFSGGEKKRAEILQMLVLRPEMAVLDETDSGLDIDSLRVVSEAVNTLRDKNFSALVITHYKRILNYIKPDHVHVLVDGKIVLSGDSSLADHLEQKGYGWITEDKIVAVNKAVAVKT